MQVKLIQMINILVLCMQTGQKMDAMLLVKSVQQSDECSGSEITFMQYFHSSQLLTNKQI